MAAAVGGGPAAPLVAPVALLSFTADLLYTTQLQFRLAFDMAVLYGAPIDPDDPEDLVDLLKVAFGVKAGELANEAISKLGPQAVKQGVKSIFKGAVLEWLKALPVVGKYLLQKNIMKFAIPLVNIPLSAGMNYWWTHAIAKRARGIYRDRATLNEEAAKLVEALDHHGSLLDPATLWFITKADGKQAEGEAILLRSVGKQLAAHGQAEDVLKGTEGTSYPETLRHSGRRSGPSQRTPGRSSFMPPSSAPPLITKHIAPRSTLSRRSPRTAACRSTRGM